jgi:hypothetical protein
MKKLLVCLCAIATTLSMATTTCYISNGSKVVITASPRSPYALSYQNNSFEAQKHDGSEVVSFTSSAINFSASKVTGLGTAMVAGQLTSISCDKF